MSGKLIKYKKLARKWTETAKYINDPLSGRTWNENESVTHKITITSCLSHLQNKPLLFQLVSQR